MLAVPAEHPLGAHDSDVSTCRCSHGEQLLLLEEGHCLRAQALSVCQLHGAGERAGFRATSLETLRQMVAAGVRHHPAARAGRARTGARVPGHPPAAVPTRRRRAAASAMVWRPTSGLGEFLPMVADALRAAVHDLPVTVLSTDPGAAPAGRRRRHPARDVMNIDRSVTSKPAATARSNSARTSGT